MLSIRERLSAAEADMVLGDYGRCIAHGEAVFDEAHRMGDRLLASEAALLVAKAHSNMEDHASSAAWAGRASNLAGVVGATPLEAQALTVHGAALAALGDPGGAVISLDKALALSEGVTSSEALDTIFTGVGLSYMSLGMPQQALPAFRRALERTRNFRSGVLLQMRANVLGAAAESIDLLASVAPQEAHAIAESVNGVIEAMRRDADAIGTAFARSTYLVAAASWLARADQGLQALQLLEEAHCLAPRLPKGLAYRLLIDLALAQRSAGHVDEAAVTANQARQLAGTPAGNDAPGDLHDESLLEELLGEHEKALLLHRKYCRRVLHNMQSIHMARTTQLSAKADAFRLRDENFELRRRNEGLNEHFRRLSDLASTDPLTNVANRRGLESAFDAMAASGQSFSVALLDLDHFKQVNDQHSHTIGDHVLRQVAATIERALRENDVVGRFGGEEFLVLISETDARGLPQVVERIRRSVEKTNWERFATGLRVTLSGGAVCATAGEDLASAVARADALLYRAKKGGRNLAVCDGMQSGPSGEDSAGETVPPLKREGRGTDQ